MSAATVERPSVTDSPVDIALLSRSLRALSEEDVSALPVTELASRLRAWEAASAQMELLKARTLIAFADKNGHRVDFAASVQTWLRSQLHMDSAEASARARTARALPELPRTAAALAVGEVSIRHVDAITSGLVRLDLATVKAAENALLDLAVRSEPRQVKAAVSRLVQLVDPEESPEDRAARQHAARYLHLTRGHEGTWTVEGRLDPAAGLTLDTALSALAGLRPALEGSREGGADLRTHGQRRADALLDLAERALDEGRTPTVAGVRPHVSLVVDLPTLREEVSLAEPGNGLLTVFESSFDPATLERLTCGGDVACLIVGEWGQPLAYGRDARFASPAQNRALLLRDGGCIAPGCTNTVLQAHHVVHWARGGKTNLGEMVLLCSPCHRLLHRDRWRIRADPDRPGLFRFHPPDGRPPFPAAHAVDRDRGSKVALPCP